MPRVRCGTCAKTIQVMAPWACPNSGFSLLMEALWVTLCKAMAVSQVAQLLGVSDGRVWHTLVSLRRSGARSRCPCSRGEGEVAIDPARFGIEGHVNDLPRSRKAERKEKQRPWVHGENLRRSAWRLVRVYRRKDGYRVGLERTTRRDGKQGATHTKRKRASFLIFRQSPNRQCSDLVVTENGEPQGLPLLVAE